MFRTIEFSNKRFSCEGLQFITVKSRSLRARVDITLFVPAAAEGKTDIPVATLLHGVYGSHWAWALNGGAHLTAQRLIASGAIPPMVLAIPSDGLWGDGSGYVRHMTQDFERWIVDEVPAAVRLATEAVSERSHHFIGGLSMGGFGALRLGGKYPERFRAISGHSSITHFDQLKQFVEEDLSSYHCPPEDRSAAETLLRNKDRLPALRFDCGTTDPLIQHNRELHQFLDDRSIPHSYEEFPGGHEWPYWEMHLEDSLRFFAAQL